MDHPNIFLWTIILPWARGDTSQSPVLIYSTDLLIPVSLRKYCSMMYSALHARITCMKFVIPMFLTADQWAETKSMIVLYACVCVRVRFILLLNQSLFRKCCCIKNFRSLLCITNGNHEYVHFLLNGGFTQCRCISLLDTKNTEWRKGEGEIYES